MTIYDLLTSNDITAYWEELTQDRQPYFFEPYFPADKKLGLDLNYIKGSSGLPVELSVSAFDVQAVPRNRIGFDKVTAEMPFFRESFTIDERTRQELNTVLAGGNEKAKKTVIDHIYNDAIQLLEGAAVSRERMRASAVSTGYITLQSNGQEYHYDYGVPENHKFDEPTFNAADTDICSIINKCCDTIEDDTGERPEIGLVTRSQMNKITQNKWLAKNIYVLTNGVGTVNANNAISYIEEQTGVRLVVYNKKYTATDGNTYRYLDDNTIVLMPDSQLGTTWFGTTPEESDLMAGSAANVSITDVGVAVTTTKRVNPVNVDTIVSMICLPSFEAADKVAIIDVTSTSI